MANTYINPLVESFFETRERLNGIDVESAHAGYRVASFHLTLKDPTLRFLGSITMQDTPQDDPFSEHPVPAGNYLYQSVIYNQFEAEPGVSTGALSPASVEHYVRNAYNSAVKDNKPQDSELTPDALRLIASFADAVRNANIATSRNARVQVYLALREYHYGKYKVTLKATLQYGDHVLRYYIDDLPRMFKIENVLMKNYTVLDNVRGSTQQILCSLIENDPTVCRVIHEIAQAEDDGLDEEKLITELQVATLEKVYEAIDDIDLARRSGLCNSAFPAAFSREAAEQYLASFFRAKGLQHDQLDWVYYNLTAYQNVALASISAFLETHYVNSRKEIGTQEKFAQVQAFLDEQKLIQETNNQE